MNESTRETRPAGVRKAIAVLGTVLLLGGAVYLSRTSLPIAPAASVDDPKKSPTLRAVEAANGFLDSLDEKLRPKATYEFASEKKSAWSNLPVAFVPRNGVKLGDLKKEQRDKAMAVVASVLSKDGYQKVVDIMD